jgi:cellulose synthase/poly-beta-1,6-N-acetylglucosamine synthase-like glycosyltransferase
MMLVAYIFVGIYVLTLSYITIYCLLQFNLLYHYQQHHRKQKSGGHQAISIEEYPFVTVQLPIYNEMYVIERLIDRVTEFDYPKERFEIHILDDSTDETVEIVRKKVEEYQAKGFQIAQILRDDREGYKAGALKAATPQAKGEFIAIFDADFVPRKDFLKETIPYFQNEKVGVVQTRWVHLNEDYSLLTRLQAIQLNVHFTVEQQGRSAGNYMLQFNGTAGVWRRQTIAEAGGWEADTLTEDLDLSIRAQLKGWEIKYLEKFDSPAELPADINGLKSQQFRWMKGGAETAKKMLPTVWRSDLSLRQKFHATIHLLSSSIFVFVFIAGLFSVPTLFLVSLIGVDTQHFGYFLAGLLSVAAVYYVANVQAELNKQSFLKRLFKFIFIFPVFLSLSMGLSLHNTVAVIQGYLGKKTAFVRTPKFNIQSISDNFKKTNYRNYRISWTTIFEGILALYFTAAVIYGFQTEQTDFILFHVLLAVGYGTIFLYTLKHLNSY